jgi:polyisoprenyl-teichoic acid--peptidoglycan teichoic acid transferase
MQPKFKRHYWPKVKLGIYFIIILFAAFVIGKTLIFLNQLGTASGLSLSMFFGLLKGDNTALKSTDNLTNILVLGIGGKGHDGPDLTDTIIVFSLNFKSRQVYLTSVPRDVWSEMLKDKINSAYHYGNEKEKNGGIVLSKVAVEDVIGMPIHYVAVVDFSAFKKFIDTIGGVDVFVKTGFTDNEYPIAGKENDLCNGDTLYKCRYQSVSFTAGVEHMDGERALVYVRSRHAEGESGSDFSRGERQQAVIIALRKRIIQFAVWQKLITNMNTLKIIDDTVDSDLNFGEMALIARLMLLVKADQIQKISLENDFINPPESQYDGRYVLIPKDSWEQIHDQIKSLLYKK